MISVWTALVVIAIAAALLTAINYCVAHYVHRLTPYHRETRYGLVFLFLSVMLVVLILTWPA